MRKVIIILVLSNLVILIYAQSELDHTVNTTRKCGWLVKSETRCKKTSVEKEPDKVLDSLVVLILISAAAESIDDRVHRVDLHGLLGSHVARHGGILEGLGLHDTLHVGGPAVLASDETTWGGGETVGDDDLLGLVTETSFMSLAEVLTGGLLLLELLLLILGLLEVETLLGDGDKLLAIVLLELLDTVLINRINHEDHIIALLLELLDEWSGLNGGLRLTGDVVDVLLLLLHASDIVLERGHLVTRLGR